MIRFSRMSPDDWSRREKVIDLLANRLALKHVSVFLGAGLSMDLGLPDWGALIRRLHDGAKLPIPGGLDLTTAAEVLYSSKFGKNRIAFAEAVREALYQSFSVAPRDLDGNRLLSAIGALVMSSVRGSASNVVTFNFDDVLEHYLRWRGFAVEAVDELPTWSSNADVRVLHPHGLLSLEKSIAVRRGVVLTQLDFDEIVGDARHLWRQKITDIMRSSICLFIGLSGNDDNLTSMLLDVQKNHSATGMEQYWGVRLCKKGDVNNPVWEHRGVCPFELADHSEVPDFLFEVCQRAAAIRQLSV